jgi:hypothetical protein
MRSVTCGSSTSLTRSRARSICSVSPLRGTRPSRSITSPPIVASRWSPGEKTVAGEREHPAGYPRFVATDGHLLDAVDLHLEPNAASDLCPFRDREVLEHNGWDLAYVTLRADRHAPDAVRGPSLRERFARPVAEQRDGVLDGGAL